MLNLYLQSMVFFLLYIYKEFLLIRLVLVLFSKIIHDTLSLYHMPYKTDADLPEAYVQIVCTSRFTLSTTINLYSTVIVLLAVKLIYSVFLHVLPCIGNY